MSLFAQSGMRHTLPRISAREKRMTKTITYGLFFLAMGSPAFAVSTTSIYLHSDEVKRARQMSNAFSTRK
jgi:hypothetical protein